jgi:hypothetical protein
MAAAKPWLHPTARASRRLAPHPSSGSPASPSGGFTTCAPAVAPPHARFGLRAGKDPIAARTHPRRHARQCYVFRQTIAADRQTTARSAADWRRETHNAAQAEYNRPAALVSHRGP